MNICLAHKSTGWWLVGDDETPDRLVAVGESLTFGDRAVAIEAGDNVVMFDLSVGMGSGPVHTPIGTAFCCVNGMISVTPLTLH